MKIKWLVFVTLLGWYATALADYDDGVNAYKAGNYAEALSEFRQLADKGVVLAYTNLGYMYALGEGVEADMAQAASWFDRAANSGSTTAQLTLGTLYFHGDGVTRHLPSAYAWFNLAATAGRQDALDFMNLVVEQMNEEQLAEAQNLSRDLFNRLGVRE